MRQLAYRPILFIVIFLGIFTLILVSVWYFGQAYRRNIQNESLDQANDQLVQDDYDIRRIKLTDEAGQTIEILQNGTLIRTNADGTKQAILGFGKLRQLFGTLSEDELRQLELDYAGNATGYTVEIETKSGNIYTIIVPSELIGDDSPLQDLIDEIEETTENTLDPTPIPTPLPTPTTYPTPAPSPIPSPSAGSVHPTPTPSPNGNPTPSPSPSSLPAYMTAEPFDCSDYSLVKKTVISNIICDPIEP